MNLINLFDIDTPHGTRSFKLMEGDIAELNIPIDIVIAGAFKGGYNPTPGSLFGSLKEKRNISVSSESPLNALCLASGLCVLNLIYPPSFCKYPF